MKKLEEVASENEPFDAAEESYGQTISRALYVNAKHIAGIHATIDWLTERNIAYEIRGNTPPDGKIVVMYELPRGVDDRDLTLAVMTAVDISGALAR